MMLRVGLIGLGHWGPNIARSMEQTGRATVRWVCDLDEARLETATSRLPSARATSSIEEVLGDADVDAVAVSTPVNTHFDLVRKALEADKHVMVEKPMTRTGDQARQLVELAAQRERVLMVGHVFEYNASIRALKRLVDSGELGEIHYLSFVRTNLGPVRTDVNALWDLASHDISIMSYVLEQAPTDVTARGQAFLNSNVEDAVFATFSFPTGMLAHVNVSWLNPRKVRQITVVGDKKMAVWDDLSMQRPIQIYDRHIEGGQTEHGRLTDTFLEYKTTVVDGGVYIPSIRLNQPLLAECEHFLDCVENDKTPQSDGMSGLRVVLALEAATESMARGSAVQPIPAP
ncbi:MAG: Gfo/Idh/MocA family oxidoreductase [Planctomycetota bacterium]